MNLCPFKKFKTVLGIPGKGIHRFRILDTAIFDYVFTIVMAFISAYLLHIPLVLSTILWFIMGMRLIRMCISILMVLLLGL